MINSRKVQSVVFIIIGLVLINSVKYLSQFINTITPLIDIIIFALSPIGLIFLIIGIYRAATSFKNN